jgi:chorismate-pyruvate lyase
MFSVYRWFGRVLLGSLLVTPAFAQPAPVKQLEADLAASPSATQFLTRRCAALKLASPPVIRAVRVKLERPASAEVRRQLGVSAGEPVRYRRVQLDCGSHVLSQADNWYVPARLTPAMNRTLDTTEIPFGAVVKPLNFHRKTLKLEPGKETLRVTAVLISGAGAPFSLVVENYSRALTGSQH